MDSSIFDKISSLAKRRGFIYPGSEIYGGLSGTWDYGPLGVELKRNIKEEFWKTMVRERDDVVGLDAAIFMNPKVWEASGHLKAFSDPLVECKKCHHRFREDSLKTQNSKLKAVFCPNCGGKEFTEPKQFNLMVEASLGVIEGEKQKVYLRGEITQGVHVNFKQVLDSTRVKIPFGIAQIGKAFRNEITPGDFTFRSREFEQMELQFYVRPNEKESMKWFEYWKKERLAWYEKFGMNKKHLRFHEHAPNERAHYARAAFDIEYCTGEKEWREVEGIHHRADWDLGRHAKFSGKDLTYFDEESKERFIPWVIETSGGVDRAALFFLMDAYHEEKLSPVRGRPAEGTATTASGRSASNGVEKETRTVLKLHPKLAPYKVAVFPLLANKENLVKKAKEIYSELKKKWMVAWDERGNIGKRYRSQDEAGTPYCVTVDFDTLDDGTVTVRDRDSMKQERVLTKELSAYLEKKLV